MKPNTIKIDEVEEVEYVRADSLKTPAPSKDGLTYCIVHTYSTGVWAGWVDLKNYGEKMIVKDARRLWRWWSEFTLSALAITGIKPGKEQENKYAMPVDQVYLTNVIEIIPCTETAKNQIEAQPNYSE
jgi:hypothetical protein